MKRKLLNIWTAISFPLEPSRWRERGGFSPALQNHGRLHNTYDPNKTLDLNSGENPNMVQHLNAAMTQIQGVLAICQVWV